MKFTILSVIFAAFSLSGLYAAKKEKKRLELLSELERLVLYMGSEIELYRRELFEIYSAFDSPLLDSSGFSKKLGELDFTGAVEHLSLDSDSTRILCELGATLGLLPAAEQKVAIDRCSSELKLILDRTREEYPKKRKLYISFGLMLGAIIFIIGI